MGKIISVTNQKGGVGKTTTAVNLSASLGARGLQVLLIDLDPQGNSTQAVGINKQNVKLSSYDLLINNAKIQDVIIPTEFKNLSLLPTNNALIGAEVEMVDMKSRESVLKNSLLPVQKDYDYIIIDCPPSLGLLTLNALCSSDSILIPIQCEFFALEGLTQLISHIRIIKRQYNPKIDIEGVLLTMYDGRLNLTQQVVAEVKKYLPKKVYKTVIPRAVRLSEAPSYGKPIIYYDKTCKASKSYENLASELVDNNVA